MGGNNSKNVSIDTNYITSIVSNTIIERIQKCETKVSSDQTLRITAGNNSSIILTGVRMNSNVSSTAVCLMSTKFDIATINEIEGKIKSSLTSEVVKMPPMTVGDEDNTQITSNILTDIKNNIKVSNILKNTQEAIAAQLMDITAGNNSNIVFNDVVMNTALMTLNQTVQDDVVSIAQSAVVKNTSDGNMAVKEVNPLQVFDDMLKSAFSGLNTSMLYLVFGGIVACVGLYIFMSYGGMSLFSPLSGLTADDGLDEELAMQSVPSV